MCSGCAERDRKYLDEIGILKENVRVYSEQSEILKDRVDFWKYKWQHTLEGQIEDLKLRLTNKYSSIKEIS